MFATRDGSGSSGNWRAGSPPPARVLGIDPGVSRCGYGCIERDGGGLVAVAAGVVTTAPADPLPSRLVELARELDALVRELAPDAVAVERVLFQTNARTAMSVGQAAGLALVSAERAGCEIATYSANEVKLAVCGWGGATKEQVQRSVQLLCKLPTVPRPPDVADALGLALCHLSATRGRDRIASALDARKGRS